MEGELQSKAGGKEFLPNSKQRASEGVKMLRSGDTEWVLYYQHWSWSLQGPIPISTMIVLVTLGLAFWQMLERLCWSSLGNSNIGLYQALSDQEDLQSTLPGVSVLKASPQTVKDGRNHQGMWGKKAQAPASCSLVPGNPEVSSLLPSELLFS